MRIDTAIRILSDMIYKPGWIFEVTDHESRFEGTVNVKITYPAMDSGEQNAPEYTVPVPGGARASFPIIVGDLADHDTETLFTRLVHVIMKIEEHEAREFLRVWPSKLAPLHPHTIDGMRAWHRQGHRQDMALADLGADLGFGVS